MKSERNGFWKISVFAILFAVLAFISIGCASADTIYVPEGGNQTIQQAVDNASEGDTIIVSDGTYNENVDVDKAYLTIRSENGSANCIVNASVNTTHVFEVKQDYVNISGFTVTNATGSNQAGIQLSNVDHCNISSNTASNNNYGILLRSSSNNNLTNNTASNNNYGILLSYSSNNNTLTSNTASNNNYGIRMSFSSNNTLTSNTASNNNYGIRLSSSSNNTLTSNNASDNYDGIYLYYSSNNNLTNNTANSNGWFGIYLYYSSNNNNLTNNTASNNNYGILLSFSSSNNLTNNTASNNNYGIGLSSSSNNNVSCNWVQNNTNAGFYLLGIYLTGGSTGNTIEKNNIIANGALQGDGSYRWQLANNQPNEVSTAGNWWGTADTTRINASIHDWTYDVGWGNVTTSPNHDWTGWTYDAGWGNVTTSPRLDGPSPCAPTPEPYAFTTADAVIALEIAVGSRPPNSRYDVSGDGRVTSLDALIILQMAAGGKR
ncbi:hypothetical protein DRN76_02255 [Methanosarcinales archaeon]|nr:MAG: hypothetical protein DRN76_02255 [Methanosarcinales archaeon]